LQTTLDAPQRKKNYYITPFLGNTNSRQTNSRVKNNSGIKNVFKKFEMPEPEACQLKSSFFLSLKLIALR